MTAHVQGEPRPSHTNIHAFIKLQSLWRGYRVRRNFLSKTLFLSSKAFIDKCSDMSLQPKASAGITKVYLPDHLPVVFKELGPERSKKRFLTMCEARDLCCLMGYRHLLIPSAHPYQRYNIEDKLPVHAVTQREQIALYSENKDKFTQAVREFTGFLCHSIFPDILTETHPYQRESKIPLVRCDNLPLVMEKDKGKIALIDLGGYAIRKEPLSLVEAIESAKTAIFIFPYHFNAIFEAIVENCPEAYSEKAALQELCNEVIHRYKSIYEDHRDFILQKIHSPHSSNQKNIRAITTFEHSPLQSLDFQVQFVEKIMSQIPDILTEETSSMNSLVQFVCSRSITIKCRSILDSFAHDLSAEEAMYYFQCILDSLVEANIICFANQFNNRFGEPSIRIHY